MNIYYKYLSHIDEDTFNNPTIRLSVPQHLNDPFESAACTTFQNKFKIKSIPEHSIIYSTPLIKHTIKFELNKFCIISLSETSRNLLMWSHYANEHRGICIGYTPDFIKPEDHKTVSSAGYFEPIPVKYDSLRYYDDEQESELTNEEQLFKILTIKSNEWIYEKEHRCIVPINYADTIKLNNLSEFEISLLIRAYKDDLEKEIKNGKYNPLDLERVDLGAGYTLRNYFENKRETVLLKAIPPEKINRIYFGCRYPVREILGLISKIKSTSHPLHHVKLFRYELDDERFELKENLVYSPTLNPAL